MLSPRLTDHYNELRAHINGPNGPPRYMAKVFRCEHDGACYNAAVSPFGICADDWLCVGLTFTLRMRHRDNGLANSHNLRKQPMMRMQFPPRSERAHQAQRITLPASLAGGAPPALPAPPRGPRLLSRIEYFKSQCQAKLQPRDMTFHGPFRWFGGPSCT